MSILSLCSLLVLLFTHALIDSPIFIQQLAVGLVTGMLIVAEPTKFTAAIMENNVLRKVGLISFSFYIWHWPCLNFSDLIFGHYAPTGNASNISKLAAIITAYCLSLVSFRYVENRFRYQPAQSNTQSLITTVFLASVILLLGPIAETKNGNLWRFSGFKIELLTAKSEHFPENARYVESAYNEGARDRPFVDQTKRKIFLIGDSFSQDFYNVLNEGGFLKGSETSAVRATKECFVPIWVDLETIIGDAAYRHNNCGDSPRFGDDLVDAKVKQSDLVVIASAWQDYSASKVDETVEYIQSKFGPKNIVVVGTKGFKRTSSLDVILLPETDLINWYVNTPDYIISRNQVLQKTQNAYFLDLQRLVCGNTDNCPVLDDNQMPIAYDGRHLSKSGAVKIANLLSNDLDFVEFWFTALEGI